MIGFTDYSECSVRQVSNSGLKDAFPLLTTVNAPQRSGYEYLIRVTLLITVNIDEKGIHSLLTTVNVGGIDVAVY